MKPIPSISLYSEIESGNLVKVGDTITYYIRIENNGAVLLGESNAKSFIPAGTVYVDNSISHNGKVIGNELYWDTGQLEVGEIITVSFQVKVTEPINITNIAFANDKATNTTNHTGYVDESGGGSGGTTSPNEGSGSGSGSDTGSITGNKLPNTGNQKEIVLIFAVSIVAAEFMKYFITELLANLFL